MKKSEEKKYNPEDGPNGDIEEVVSGRNTKIRGETGPRLGDIIGFWDLGGNVIKHRK